MGAKFEIPVEWKLYGVAGGNDWCLFQPHTVFAPAQMQYRVPAVGCLPQFAGAQFTEVEADVGVYAER